MNVGRLRHRASLYRMQRQRNELGEVKLTPVQYGYAWCRVEETAGEERQIGGRVTTISSTDITMRYTPGMKASDRIVAHGKTYEIESVTNTLDRNVELIATCKTVNE